MKHTFLPSLPDTVTDFPSDLRFDDQAGTPRSSCPTCASPRSRTAPPDRSALQVTGIVRKGGSAVVPLGVPRGGELRLQALDVQGRLVGDQDLGPYPPGWHTLTWSPRTATGRELASAIYYLRLCPGGDVATGRVVVLK